MRLKSPGDIVVGEDGCEEYFSSRKPVYSTGYLIIIFWGNRDQESRHVWLGSKGPFPCV